MSAVRGGDKFSKALREIADRVSSARAVRVGFLAGSTYPDGTPTAMIAAIQNYGSATIPARPFFSNMIKRKRKEWGPALANLLLKNKFDARKSLDILGLGIAGQLKESIVETNAPPLAPSTIKRKGFSKPLIFTSHMINSIDSQVVE